jgi:ABC-type polysaccharide/polyol phosphate export permease
MNILKGSYLVVPIAMVLSAALTFLNADTEYEKYDSQRYISNVLFVGLISAGIVYINSEGNGTSGKIAKKLYSMNPLTTNSGSLNEKIFTGAADF